MMCKIFFLLCFIFAGAQAQVTVPTSGDIMLNISRGDGTFQSRYVDTDKSGNLQFLMFGQDPTPGAPIQLRPQKRLLGSNIVCTVTTCDVPVTAGAPGAAGAQGPVGPQGPQGTQGIPGTAGTTSYLGLTDLPTTFAPSMHTHPASGISDSSAIGRSVLTAADAATARTLLGVPTVPTINRAIITTTTAGTYTWTLPVPCPAGQLPIVEITPEDSGTAVVNPKITAKTNAAVTINALRTEPATLLGLTLLSIPATAVASVLHVLAVCP